jgi:hypothetical protein
MKYRPRSVRASSFAAWLVLAGCVAGAALAASGTALGSPTTANGERSMTLYSVASEEQFVNNADDRQRGKGNNPFGNYKDLTATTKEHGNGPFPGDEALFKFNVFVNEKLKASAGKAVFTCEYNFNKNAFCDVAYQLAGGTLIGAGEFNFNASKFAIAITGGTGKYRGARGDLEATPGPNHSQRLALTFQVV